MLSQPSTTNSFWDQHRSLLLLILVSIFLLAGAIRLYKIQAPGMLPERDFGSAILARDFFFRSEDSIPEWEREVSSKTVQTIPILEPPVTEFLVSILYRVAGSEHMWIARVLTSIFWLIGGIFLYKIARSFLSTGAAIVSTAFYLFAPLGILLRRSFQPDALMMLMFLVSLYAILKYYEQPVMPRLIIAGTITGLTLLYRPIVLFTLLAAFIALGIAQQRSWKGAFNRQTAIFLTMSLLPPLLYYGYITLLTDGAQTTMSFQPHLYLRREYWRGWLDSGLYAVGAAAIVVAMLGLAILPLDWPLAMLSGLWLGYIVFGLTFNYHTQTHPYYQAQLIPIVALSFGPLVDLIGDRLKTNPRRHYWILPIGAIMILGMTLSVLQVRGVLANPLPVRKETEQAIGEIVHHSTKAVYVANNYGITLEYNGKLTGSYWPRRIESPLYLSTRGQRILSIEERLAALNFVPEYFIITNFREYEQNHTDLRDYLDANCSIFSKSDEYLIYSGCRSLIEDQVSTN